MLIKNMIKIYGFSLINQRLLSFFTISHIAIKFTIQKKLIQNDLLRFKIITIKDLLTIKVVKIDLIL